MITSYLKSKQEESGGEAVKQLVESLQKTLVDGSGGKKRVSKTTMDQITKAAETISTEEKNIRNLFTELVENQRIYHHTRGHVDLDTIQDKALREELREKYKKYIKLSAKHGKHTLDIVTLLTNLQELVSQQLVKTSTGEPLRYPLAGDK